MPKSVPKRIQTCFRVIFSKKFNAQCSVEGRVFENFQKFFFSKFQKCPKSFPKESKRVLIVIWDNFFEKFLPSFPWKVKSSKIFKKIKKDSNFLKCPKSFPKVSKRVLDVFGANFRKIFAQFSMECLVFKSFQKKIFSKFQKCPKSFPKVSKRVLNVFWGNFFENFFAQCSVEGQVFEKFQIFCSKFQKCPKVFPKESKRVLG